MKVGIGLPTSTAGASGDLLVEWAQRAEAGPFSSLGAVDRLAYPCLEPLSCLAAAAAVTARVRLASTILIGPLRDASWLCSQAASLDVLSGGRLVLGLGIGARHDDYRVAGVEHSRRGWDLALRLVQLRGRNHLPLLVGGDAPAFARAARFADGYCHGGGPPRAFAAAAGRARAAWQDLGRPGEPQLWGQGYFALGQPELVERGRKYLRDYYRFTGGFEERIAAACLTTASGIKDFVRGYDEEGCNELVLFPTVSSLDQLDSLAGIL